MNKTIIAAIIGVIVVGGGNFYAGMKYGEKKTVSDRQARIQQFSGGQRGMRFIGSNGGAQGGGFVGGEIIAKDDKSITVKLRDARQSGGEGGSKIVFFSDSTQILKPSSGSKDDLTVGEQVMVAGTANSDGSISAESIQLRPPQPQQRSE